jgi:hypothetical protein
MVDNTEGLPVQQTHNGIGPQIGRDNYAPIKYEVLLDARIKALVEKFAATAPGLSKAIEKAARDGIMSPEAIAVLDRVADHINWDIATILRNVGDRINWDVAEMLLSASKGINEEVADEFVRVQRELKGTAGELDASLRSLRSTVGQLKSLKGGISQSHYEPAETAGFVAVPSSAGRDTLWFKFKVFCCGSGLGLLGAVLLMSHHHSGWAVTAAVATLATPAISLIKWILARD